MSTFKARALMSVSAIAAAASMSAGAMAQTAPTTNIYGGGSSLDAPFLKTAEDCYGNPSDLVVKGGNPVTEPAFNYTGATPQNCATTHTDPSTTLYYDSTGSGTGIKALYSNNPSNYVYGPTNASQEPKVHYAASDTALDANDVGIYNNGGAGGHVGLTVAAPGATPTTGQVANPKAQFGALVQFPILITPVTIAYSPVYKQVRNADGSITSYHFNNQYPRTNTADGGGIRMNQDLYCKIFNGTITNFNDPAFTTLNKKVSLKDPTDPTPVASFSVPIQIVGRSDSSGTTSLWTRHLAAACAAVTAGAGQTYTNNYADATTTLPSALQGPIYDKTQATNASPAGETVGKYTLASGSDGVAKYVAFTFTPGTNPGDTLVQGRIGYVGPDYVNPVTNKYGLVTASVASPVSGGLTYYVAPTAAAAAKAFLAAGNPPQSDTTGAYVAANPGSRADPSQWVQPASKGSPLAFPTGANTYPITGTSNYLGYTCYADQATGYKLNQFMTYYITKPIVFSAAAGAQGILPTSGFAALPAVWRTAIKNTFLYSSKGATSTTTGDASSLNLYISPKGDVTKHLGAASPKGRDVTVFAHNAACDSLPGAS